MRSKTGRSRLSRKQSAVATGLALLLAAFLTQPALADGDQPSAQFTLGAKVWDTQWTSWDTVPTRSLVTGGPVSVIEPVSTNNHFAVIPQASVRYGNFLGSASYLVDTTYTLSGAIDPESGESLPVAAKRKEFDANVGYYVLPSVAVTVGYKQINQTFGPSSSSPELFKWSGPTIGLSGAATLRSYFGLYGAVGVGFLKLRVDQQLEDAAGNTSFNAIYTLGEAGFAYSVPTSSKLSFTVTLGYRVQIVTTEKYALNNGFSNGRTIVDVHDTTQGPALTFVARY